MIKMATPTTAITFCCG